MRFVSGHFRTKQETKPVFFRLLSLNIGHIRLGPSWVLEGPRQLSEHSTEIAHYVQGDV